MTKRDFKIGADPEFGFLDTHGSCISADGIINTGNNDSDEDDEDETDSESEEFGYDGCGTVAEIRPKPSTNPLEVVTNISKAMHKGIRSNADTINYEWKAGSLADSEPIGGHIHFGTKALNKRTFVVKEALDSLDRYLAQSLILLEDPVEARSRRGDHDYGALGNFRDQEWGFEYRTPASWLTSPYIAAGVLCLAKAIVWEVVYNGLGSHREVEIDDDNFFEAELDPIRKLFARKIWPDIRKFELYKEFRKPIDLLHTLIAKRRNWFPSCGMKAAWAIHAPTATVGGEMRRTSLQTIWRDVA